MSNVLAHPPALGPIVSPLRWWVCILLMQATVINYMDRIALNQMAVQIQVAFQLDNLRYGWLESVFSVAFAIGAISTGYVVDKVNVRWIYPLMVIGWSAAGILTGFAGSFWMLLTCRFMLGLFEAGNWPCAIRTIRTVMRPDERSFGNSLFGSGTALGAVLTPMVVLALLKWAETNGYAEPWRIPFQIIGSLGLVWVALWILTVPGRVLNPTDTTGVPPPPQGVTNFIDVFRDSRFWVLLTVALAVNIMWHGYRAWLPLYLQKQRGYTFAEMSRFTTLYYLVADVGTWTVGLLTLIVCRRGMGLHPTRVLMYTICSLFTLCTILIPFLPDGWQLRAVLLIIAFGALGLFPTYFALSQELSSKHQGKITGILGASAHLTLAIAYPIEGKICDLSGSYELVLGGIGLFPLLALGVVLWLWPPWYQPSSGK